MNTRTHIHSYNIYSNAILAPFVAVVSARLSYLCVVLHCYPLPVPRRMCVGGWKLCNRTYIYVESEKSGACGATYL